MNKVSRRAWMIMALALLLTVGLLAFGVRYALRAKEWVTFPGSPHLYSGGNPNTGVVTDRSGVLLLDASEGRHYTEDTALRASAIHLLGDRYGYIDAPILGHYMGELSGYSVLNGLYGVSSERRAELTLSAKAQKAAYEALKGKKGTVGVYNYKTGELLCAVSAPNYDPDNAPDLSLDTSGAYEGVYVNRFLGSTYTPGSVFKTLTAAAALETVEDAAERSFFCEGSCVVEGERIVCTGTHGRQTLEDALCNSCNCAFSELISEMGRETLQRYVSRSGITEALSFDGTTTSRGHFDVTDASAGGTAWAGIGQYTDLINPCRFMVFMGMLANGGKAAQPYLMARVSAGERVSYRAGTTLLESGLKPETTEAVARMMRNNVVNGYGSWLFPQLCVCGKSGTAETTDGRAANALFAGFIQDPDYPLAFIVIVEEGGSGAATAAPIAGRVLQACVDDLS